VYVLEKLLGTENEQGRTVEPEPILEGIYFRPDHRIVFPTSDISRIERLTQEEQSDKIEQGKEIIRLTLMFLGLYGIFSPLPNYFSEIIAIDAEKDEPDSLRDFLDIFNHRLYLLLYQAWKKYRHYLYFQSEDIDQLTSYMLSLLGSDINAFSASGDLSRQDKKNNSLAIRLLTYAGLIRQFPRSAAGLRTLLHSFFGGVTVKIQEFIPRWVNLPATVRPRLGTKYGDIEPKLGETMIVGERVLDFNNKFRIILGPLSLEEFQSFLPDGCNAMIFRRLVQFYAPAHLEFDVELLLKKDEAPPLKLGDKYARLGWISWLGEPQKEVGSVLISPTLA
jgi:type VI secretion system protein ImpH